MKRLLLAAVLVLLACGRKNAPPAPPVPFRPALPPNLLQMMRGSAVADRTGESTLDNSAVRMIDGDDRTAWLSPLEDSEQSVTFALSGIATVEQVGIVTTSRQYQAPKKVRFDLSEDGVHFRSAGTFDIAPKSGPQLFRIAPARAWYVRLSTVEPDRTLQINEAWVAGVPPRQTSPPALDACWTINGSPAVFRQRGAAVSGFVGGMLATALEGGCDGGFCRFAWIRGAEYGLAALSVAGNPPRLSGIVWHEEAIQMQKFMAADWLGESAACVGPTLPSVPDVFRTFLEKQHYFPLYGLRFDDGGRLLDAESAPTLDRVTAYLAANPSLGLRLKLHELTKPNPQDNRAVAQLKADTLRAALQRRGAPLGHLDFVVLGADHPRRDADTEIVRAMYSSIEIELVR